MLRTLPRSGRNPDRRRSVAASSSLVCISTPLPGGASGYAVPLRPDRVRGIAGRLPSGREHSPALERRPGEDREAPDDRGSAPAAAGGQQAPPVSRKSSRRIVAALVYART